MGLHRLLPAGVVMRLFSAQRRRIPRARFFPWLRLRADDVCSAIGFLIFAWVCVYVLPRLSLIDHAQLCAAITNILACHR